MDIPDSAHFYNNYLNTSNIAQWKNKLECHTQKLILHCCVLEILHIDCNQLLILFLNTWCIQVRVFTVGKLQFSC